MCFITAGEHTSPTLPVKLFPISLKKPHPGGYGSGRFRRFFRRRHAFVGPVVHSEREPVHGVHGRDGGVPGAAGAKHVARGVGKGHWSEWGVNGGWAVRGGGFRFTPAVVAVSIIQLEIGNRDAPRWMSH